ncbi:MAG: hypothetical protein JWO71_3125 [Candidatus Acidoferrum typicum]|nr:hypothetical protein [Candidatus Acidoferrum typicum]
MATPKSSTANGSTFSAPSPEVRATRRIDPIVGGVPLSTARLLTDYPKRRLFEYFSWLRIKIDWGTGMLPAHATPRWIESKFHIGKNQRKALERELVILGLAKIEQPMRVRMVRGRDGVLRRRKVKSERTFQIFAVPQIAKQACISTAALPQSRSKTGLPNSLKKETAIAQNANSAAVPRLAPSVKETRDRFAIEERALDNKAHHDRWLKNQACRQDRLEKQASVRSEARVGQFDANREMKSPTAEELAELKRRYPDLYEKIFGEAPPIGKKPPARASPEAQKSAVA